MAEFENELCPRFEHRALFNDSELPALLSLLAEEIFVERRYLSPVVQTVYFLPLSGKTGEGYLRARRCIGCSDVTEEILRLQADDIWQLEEKALNGVKKRVFLPMGQIVAYFKGKEIFPIASTQMERRHFLDQSGTARVTVDSPAQYFAFVPELDLTTGRLMGKQSRMKLEIKDYSPGGNLSLVNRLFTGIRCEFIPDGWHEDEVRRMFMKFLAEQEKC